MVTRLLYTVICLGLSLPKLSLGQNSDTYYFPNNFFYDTAGADGNLKVNEVYGEPLRPDWYSNSLYSKPLETLNEPVLFGDYENEVYRFTWFGDFGVSHNPIAVRIEKADTVAFLILRYMKTRHYEQESVKDVITDSIIINQNDWLEFKKELADIDFWNLPSIEMTEIVTMGGSGWILEGQNDTYHMVHRFDATDKDIGKVCLYLLQHSKLKIKKREFY